MADATDPQKDNKDKKEPEKATKPDAKTSASDKPAAKTESDKTAGKKSDKPGQKAGSVPPSAPGGDAAADAAAQKSGGGLRVVAVMVVLVGVIAGGGYLTRGMWSPVVKPYLQKFVPDGAGQSRPDASTAEAKPQMTVEERLAALEQKVVDDNAAEMEALKAEAASAKADLDQALQRIDDLERRLSELREVASALTNSSVSGSADLSSVMTRIDGLEEGRRENAAEIKDLTEKLSAAMIKQAGSSAGSGVVLALAQLRDAVVAGRPYGAQLAALRRVAGENPDVAAMTSRLSDHADTGLATADALADRFEPVAAEALVHTRAASENWVDQTTAKLAGLVSLRRTDGRSGNAVEDGIAEIEQHLAERDLAAAEQAASAVADALPRQALDVFEPWLLDLKARVDAERALDAMQASALAALDGK